MQSETKERGAGPLRWIAERVGRFEDSLLNWEDAKPSRRGRGCYHAYNVLFPIMALLVLVAIPLGGRELIWNVDGISQYYPFFVYEGQWIRSIFSNLLAGTGDVIPLWEWCSGYGADIPTTFDVFLDPLNLVSAITPEALSEWVFQALVVLRLYLAGLAFTYYCRTRGDGETGTVLGALLYSLCGAGLTVVRWSSGLHALILFPVVLAGAERVLAGKRPWVFVASLTTLAIVSYYFTFMACVLLVGYLAVRVIMVERPHLTIAGFMRWVAVFAGLTLLSIALAGFAVVPAVAALSGMERLVDQSTVVPLLYAPTYYVNLLSGFLTTHDVGSDTFQGFGGMAFLACVLLFAEKGRNRELKLVLVVLSLFFLLPCVGSFFNGLNYATNRWAWAYALCMAYALTRATPMLLSLSSGQRRALLCSVAAYAFLFLVPAFRFEGNVAGFAALLGAIVIVLLAQGRSTARALLGCALALTLGVNGFYFLSADENGMASEQTPLGMAYAKLTTQSVDTLARDVGDPSWWRYDGAQYSGRIRNNSLVLGLHGIDFYNSIYNDHIDRFHTELAIAGDDINFSYTDLQGRSDLMALLGVRYYIHRDDGTASIPYGVDSSQPLGQKNVRGTNYYLYRNDAALPCGFAFDRAITRADYLELSPIQRQQALLQAVVLDDKDKPGLPQAGADTVDASQLEFEDTTLPYSVVAASGAKVEDGRIVSEVENGTVTLQFEGVPGADTYLFFQGLAYEGLKPSDRVSEEQKQAMTWPYRANLLLEDLNYTSPVKYLITTRSNASNANAYISNYATNYHMYGGKNTWLAGLGYAEEAATQVTITFDQPGVYSFDDMQVIAQTHDRRAEWLAQCSASPLTDLSLKTNHLEGAIELDQPKTLLMTIAYSNGWSATVDGAPAKLRCADTGFMALDLPKGRHTVELHYLTPGLVEGFALTGVAILATAILATTLCWRARKASAQANGRTGA